MNSCSEIKAPETEIDPLDPLLSLLGPFGQMIPKDIIRGVLDALIEHQQRVAKACEALPLIAKSLSEISEVLSAKAKNDE